MSRGKTSNAGSDDHSSSDKLLPSYIDTSEESSLDGLPEALASFDLYKYSPGEFLKRFCARRSRDRSRERRSGASLVEFEMEQNTIRRMQIWNKDGASEWWTGIEINLKGSYIMTHYFIQSQLNPKEPTGTIITVRSGRAGITAAGGLTYNISKIVEQRLNEHLQLEYPTLRVFSTMPGISPTEMVTPFWLHFAHEHLDLTGILALYLVQPRADFLKGSVVGMNWDVEELEQHKDEIVKEKVFKTSWLPILPFNGGKGLVA